MRTFVIALLAVACFAAEAEFAFKGNFSKTNKDEFKFRVSTLGTASSGTTGITLPGIGWVSAAVAGAPLNLSASIDVIAALHTAGSFVLGVGVPPLTFGTYVSGAATFDPKYFFDAITGKGKAEFSTGVIGFLVPGVIEVDSAGNYVNGISFAGVNAWSDFSEVAGTPKGVTVRKTTLTDTSKATITEYTIASEVAGYLKFAKTPVSPNSLEVVYEINDYQYQDNANHLELVFVSAVVTVGGKGTVDTMISFNNITKDFASYVALRGQVTADSNSVDVDVKATAETDLRDLVRLPPLLKTYLKTAFLLRGDVSLDYKRVAFPAGAKNIVYDPAIGAGKPVYSSASSVVLSIFAVLLAVFLLF